MNLYIRIRRLFMFPHSIIIGLWSYSHTIKLAKAKVMENPDNHYLSKADIYFKASFIANENRDYSIEVCRELEEKMGLIKYILPCIFWYMIYKILC